MAMYTDNKATPAESSATSSASVGKDISIAEDILCNDFSRLVLPGVAGGLGASAGPVGAAGAAVVAEAGLQAFCDGELNPVRLGVTAGAGAAAGFVAGAQGIVGGFVSAPLHHASFAIAGGNGVAQHAIRSAVLATGAVAEQVVVQAPITEFVTMTYDGVTADGEREAPSSLITKTFDRIIENEMRSSSK